MAKQTVMKRGRVSIDPAFDMFVISEVQDFATRWL
jgi:hypothetical protein